MTDEQISEIYSVGNMKSHTHGLRAVYEAGQNHDANAAEKAAKPVAEHEPFDQMTNVELRAYLDARGVVHLSSADKADLERMARAAERKEKAG